MLFGFLTTAYILGIFPLLFNEAFDAVLRVPRRGLAACYAKGGILTFALFWVETEFCLKIGDLAWTDLSSLAKIFLLSSAGISIIGLICFIVRSVMGKPKARKGGDHRTHGNRESAGSHARIHRKLQPITMIAILLGIAAICYSIFVVVPPTEDTTAYVEAAVSTDTIYEYEPYSMEHVPELYNGQRWAPAEILFAVICSISGAEPIFIVKTAAAIFLILLGYAVAWCAGDLIFKDQKKTAILCLLLLAADVRMTFATGDFAGGGLLLAPWRRETMLIRLVLPVVVVFGYELCKLLSQKTGRNGSMTLRCAQLREAVAIMIVALPAAELFSIRGIIYVGMILVLWAVVVVIEKIWH